MARLRAFVGHSFVEGDRDVTARIVKMLTNIAKLMEDFEWESAEPAEPKALSEKVREKMKGKNLFIGICTSREAVIDPAKLRRPQWIGTEDLRGRRVDFQTKTTDWIIQEIGMAVGRDMQLILLLEEGVRPPGGLQGDLEYIPFKREEPEKCFDKLVSMLRSLAPRVALARDATEPSSGGETATSEVGTDFLGEYLTPAESWTAREFADRLRISIDVGDSAREAQISSAFNVSKHAGDPAARAGFRASEILARAEHQKTPWLQPLRELAKEFPDQPAPIRALAVQFAASEDHERAASYYEDAARISKKPLARVSALIAAAAQRGKAKRAPEAEALLASCADIVRGNPEIEAEAMLQLGSAWKEFGNDQMFLACAERGLELAPDETQRRFDLAYRYSALGSEANALFHYRQYLRSSDDAGGWNNLGVASANLKLPILAVEAYETSEARGSSLATSNLAYAQLHAGFLAKAAEMCQAALSRPDTHARVTDCLSECQGAREKEQTKEKEFLGETSPLREFRRAMGRASIQPLPDALPKKWIGPQCEFTAELNGSDLRLSGMYERPKYSALVLTLSQLKLNELETVTVEYTGKLFGRAFVGRSKTDWPGRVNSLFSSADNGEDFIAVISLDAGKIEIYEGGKKSVTLTSAG